MPDTNAIREKVFGELTKLLGDTSISVTDDLALIGNESVLDSMRLVELCLALEDLALEIGFEFDWTSDAAMSPTRSMFRTAGSLAAVFISQMEAKK